MPDRGTPATITSLLTETPRKLTEIVQRLGGKGVQCQRVRGCVFSMAQSEAPEGVVKNQMVRSKSMIGVLNRDQIYRSARRKVSYFARRKYAAAYPSRFAALTETPKLQPAELLGLGGTSTTSMLAALPLRQRVDPLAGPKEQHLFHLTFGSFDRCSKPAKWKKATTYDALMELEVSMNLAEMMADKSRHGSSPPGDSSSRDGRIATLRSQSVDIAASQREDRIDRPLEVASCHRANSFAEQILCNSSARSSTPTPKSTPSYRNSRNGLGPHSLTPVIDKRQQKSSPSGGQSGFLSRIHEMNQELDAAVEQPVDSAPLINSGASWFLDALGDECSSRTLEAARAKTAELSFAAQRIDRSHRLRLLRGCTTVTKKSQKVFDTSTDI